MNNKELTAKLSERMGFSEQETTDVLATMTSIISSKLVENDCIYLHTLGLFEVRKRNERVIVNPVSGKRYLVPPKIVPTFKPSVAIKNKLNSDIDE